MLSRCLYPLDEDNGKLIKQLIPFFGYKSIKLSLPKTSANSLFFIRDKHDILSLSFDTINMQKQEEYYNKKNDTENNKECGAIFVVNDWSYSKNVSIVKNTVYCFDTIWEEKENYDKIMKEKKYSELLFDVVSHDIGNYHQILLSSLEIVTSLFGKSNNNNNIQGLPQHNDRIFSCLTTAT